MKSNTFILGTHHLTPFFQGRERVRKFREEGGKKYLSLEIKTLNRLVEKANTGTRGRIT